MKEHNEAKLWNSRWDDGTKRYEEWERKFQVKRLEPYYLGHQFDGIDPLDPEAPYVVNKVFSSVEARRPTLLSSHPRHRVFPRPGHEDDVDALDPRLTLLEDVLRSVVTDDALHYLEHVSLCYHQAQFSVGLLEVGYDKHFIDNPNAGKPVMVVTRDGTEVPERDDHGNIKLQEPGRTVKESLYFRCLDYRKFRVPYHDTYVLENNDWVAYEQLYGKSEIIEAFGVKPDDQDGLAAAEMSDDDGERLSEVEQDVYVVRKIWDLRAMQRVYTSGKVVLEKEPFDYLPIVDFRPFPWGHHWWPLPEVFNWIHPQREENELRRMLRAHWRKALRKYLALREAFEAGELERVLRGGDLEVGYVERDVVQSLQDAIVPLPDAALGPEFHRSFGITRDDFTEVSGVAGEQRGLAEASTATQANILDVRAQSREVGIRSSLESFLSRVGKLTLRTIRDHFGLPMVVRRTIDPTRPDAPEKLREVFQIVQVTVDFPDYEFDVVAELTSRSPSLRDQERRAFLELMQVIAQPGIAEAMAASPYLLRYVLDLYGIRSDRMVQEVQAALQAGIQSQQEESLEPGNLRQVR